MAKYVYEKYTTTFSYDDPFFSWTRSGYVYRPSSGELRVRDKQRPIRTSDDVHTFTASGLGVGDIVTWTTSWGHLTNWINGTSNISFVRIRFKESSTAYAVDRTQSMSYTDYISLVKKGSLVATVIAEEGTYPDDGIDGDYWYIKTRKAFPDIHIKVSGKLQKVQSAWVKVGGHTTPELPEGQKEYIAYANSPDGVQDFSLTPDGHAYVGLYQGLDPYEEKGRNLLLLSDTEVTNSTYSVRTLYWENAADSIAGEDYTVTVEGSLHAEGEGQDGWYLNVYTKDPLSYPRAIVLLEEHKVSEDKWVGTFQMPPPPEGASYQGMTTIYAWPLAHEGLGATVRRIKLEKGTVATPWTPARAEILAAINNPNSYTWMSRSIYNGVLKEIKDIYVKKDGQLKKGV